MFIAEGSESCGSSFLEWLQFLVDEDNWAILLSHCVATKKFPLKIKINYLVHYSDSLLCLLVLWHEELKKGHEVFSASHSSDH